jgi:hypothetical protein
MEDDNEPLMAWAGARAQKASELATQMARSWSADLSGPVLKLPLSAFKDLVRTLDAAGTAQSLDEMLDHVLLARFLLTQVLMHGNGQGASK